MAKTIFISGASRGFGKLWAEEFLKRGDKVVATARDLSHLDELVEKYGSNILPIKLDVNDRAAGFAAVVLATDYFGVIDVLINNAGYGLFGAIEETTEEEARGQIETNFFGLLWLTQAIIPVMRAQGHGHIIQVSSVLGLVTMPLLGLYNASKFAVIGLSETLAAEVKGFGIHVTVIEPNGFSTDWAGASSAHTAPLPEYDQVRAAKRSEFVSAYGDPEATSAAVMALIDDENPPVNFFLGNDAYPWVKQVYGNRFEEWDKWREISAAAHGKQ